MQQFLVPLLRPPTNPTPKPYSTIKPPKKEPAELEATLHQRREPSPELARFSALVTRPPKQKTPSTSKSIRLRIKGFKVIRLDD